MKNKQWILPVFLCLLPILFYLPFYNQLPEMMPTHFNAEGVADAFMPKTQAIVFPCLLLAAIEILCVFAMNTDPKRSNYPRQLLALSLWICPIISIVMNLIILLICLGKDVHIEVFVPVLCGILFIVIGNYLPKTRQNYTMGIKIPWTLNSEDNWRKTHRFGGFVFVLAGFWMIISSLLHFNALTILIPILAATFIPMIYSYMLYKKENQQGK